MEILVEFLRASIRLSTPLLLAALGGAYMQVAGVPNVGMEGMMLLAALVGYIASFSTGSWLIGLACGVLASVLLSLFYAFFVLKLKADIFAVGITINILMSGVTAYIIRRYYHQEAVLSSPDIVLLPAVVLRFLDRYPLLDRLLNHYSILIPIAFLLVLVTYLVFYKTPFGFWLRATGSNPLAVSASGKSIQGMQLSSFIISAVFCGLAGVHLSMGYLGIFTLTIVAGRGFIALAIVLFGGGNPLTVLIASLIFGMANAASLRIPSEIMPSQIPQMLPYILTIIAIALMSRYAKSFTRSEQ